MYRLILCVLLTLSALPLQAAVSDEELAQLKRDLLSLLGRVESLEAENQQLKASIKETSTQVAQAVTAPAAAKQSWADKLKISGDLRARYESIDQDRKDERERSRVRARVAITARPTDNTEVAVGLASGGDDPVSTNQSLGGGASTKDIRLDLAYFKWQARPGLTLIGGKMKNPWFRPGGSGLLWDGDLRPEGIALNYKGDSFFVNSGLHFLESDTKKDNARLTYNLQAGYNGTMGNGKFTAGIGYFKIGAEGRGPWYDDDFFGNTQNCSAVDCSYANDFEELELFTELSTTLADRPLTVFADYVQNQDASDLDTAWAFGFKYGKAGAPGTWELGYTYQDIEADAVLGLWSDSDFGGGDTDTRGHVLRGAWAFHEKWKVGFTYFDNEVGMDLGAEDEYRRLQLDWQYKF